MVEMNILNQVPGLISLVPVFAAVYQIYLNRPISVSNRNEVDNVMKKIRAVTPIELQAGTHDVTPQESTLNYTLQVQPDETGDNYGLLQITSPTVNTFKQIGMNRGDSKTTTSLSDGMILLKSNEGGPYVQTIVEPTDDKSKVNIFGLLVYSPKGLPIFPKK